MHRQCDWAGLIDDMRSILDYTFSLSFWSILLGI